jgi:thiamine transport system ATP-binding protein
MISPMRSGGVDIRLEDVAFTYEDMLMRFDAMIEAGHITSVMGSSGAGKSTFLNLIAGFEAPTSGRVLIGGIDVTSAPPSARPISMVFQENNLFAHLTVEQNVGLGRSPALRLTDADRAAVADALGRTGLAGKERRLPRELSGGERQRVALARVLVRDRPVLLLDEPFASLGPALREDMVDLVMSVHRERGMTVVFVTHQPEDARRIGGNLLFLEQGKVIAAGKTEEFFGKNGPEAFRNYIGTGNATPQSQEFARKPT